MKKPPRLELLILSQIAVGLVIALVGYQSSGLSGLWTSATLACFFTAHLLAIPHPSGIYWSAVVAFALMIFSLTGILAWFELAGLASPQVREVSLGLGIPVVAGLVGLLITLVTFHRSVQEFFDRLEE